MSRRRWLYRPGQPPEEVGEDWAPTPEPKLAVHTDATFAGLRTLEGKDISTRAKYREHVTRHGLARAADFKDTWAKAEKAREQLGRSPEDKAKRLEDIKRAHYRLSRGYHD